MGSQMQIEGVDTTIDDIEEVIERYHLKKMERMSALEEEKELKNELQEALEHYWDELAEVKPGLRVYKSFDKGVRALVTRDVTTSIKTEAYSAEDQEE